MSHSETESVPCPECKSTKGYARVGNFRVQCLDCNSLLKNEEVKIENVHYEDPDKES